MAKFALFGSALLVLIFAGSSSAFLRGIYPSTNEANKLIKEQFVGEDADQALYLTPYIEAGKLAEGRNLSQVVNLPGGAPKSINSFSGYLTVNKKYNSNIFFWFFPALVSWLFVKFLKALNLLLIIL